MSARSTSTPGVLPPPVLPAPLPTPALAAVPAMLTPLTTSAERDGERRATGRRSLLADRGLLVVAVLILAWLVGFGCALQLTGSSGTSRTVVQSEVYLLPIAAAVVLTALAARRAGGRDRIFWGALALFCALWLAGEVVWSVEAVAGSLPPGGEALASGLYLAYYVPGLVAALFIGGRPRLNDGLRGLFDTVVMAVATGYVGFRFAIAPALARGGSGRVVVDAVYPVLDVVIVLVAISAGVGARRSIPLSRLLATASLGCAPFLDAAYSHSVDVQGGDGHWLDLGWSVQAALVCLAAVIALRHPEHEGSSRTLPGRWTMYLVYVAMLGVFTMVGTQILRGHSVVEDVVVGAVAVLILLARGMLANAELRKTARRLELARDEQERLAVTDGLTGLYNRRFFEEFLRLEADRAHRGNAPLSLIVVDLDHFKRINDRYGHPAGDEVLTEAARRLRSTVRSSDVLARYGGEEFVLVLPETGPDTALEIAERCRRALAEAPIRWGAREADGSRAAIAVTASFGLATLWPAEDHGVDDLVRAADRALYRSKTAGRDRVSPAGEWDFLRPSADAELLATDDSAGSAGDLKTSSNPLAGDRLAVSLLRAAELVDADQGPDEHSSAMARWARAVAEALGLDARTQERAGLAARLHDLGKLAIPRSVLLKSGTLTDQDWAVIRTHPANSEALVAMSPSLAELGPAVRAHHERFDGSGYPDGLGGLDIPVEARIISVCDSWAAMRATRVYATARPVAAARLELLAGRGRQFDPRVVDEFLRLQESGLVGELARRPLVDEHA